MNHILFLLLFSINIQGAHKQGAQYTIASWYGTKYHGKPTASGEVYDKEALTCASNTLALGDVITVTNAANGKSVTVTVNDRGPFTMDRKGVAIRPLKPHPSRGLDLSRAAFAKIADTDTGIIKVSYTKKHDKTTKPTKP